MLSKIESDDTIGKCLLEVRKVESQIEQRKFLESKQVCLMMPQDNIEVTKGTDPRVKAKAKVKDMTMDMVTHKVELVEIVSFVEANTHQ